MFSKISYGNGNFKKSFIFKPYTSKDERELLISFSLNEEKIDEEYLRKTLKFLSEFIDPKPNIDELSINEVKLLLLKLRGISVGEEIPVSDTCPHCGQPDDFNLNLENLIQNGTVEPIFERDDYKIILKDTFIDSSEMIDYIYSINFNDQNLINSEDILLFIDNMSPEDYDSLNEVINNFKVTFNFYNYIKCIKCGEEIKRKMESPLFISSIMTEDSLLSFYTTISDMVYYGKYTKQDIDSMFPFERNVLYGMLKTKIDEYNQA